MGAPAGPQLVFDVDGAPAWLSLASDGSARYEGAPEPGHYDFTIRAHIVENEIRSAINEYRMTGTVPFQDPVWQTPASVDAVFTNVAGLERVHATSYGAKVRYRNDDPGAISGLQVTPEGNVSYAFESAGQHIVKVIATAGPHPDTAPSATIGMPNPEVAREFEFWALTALDTRTLQAMVSDTVQATVDDASASIAHAADPIEIDTYCDVRVIVYAAGRYPNAAGTDAAAILSLGGTDVITHTVSAARSAHVLTFPGREGDEYIVSTTHVRVFVAMFDRRAGTVRVAIMPVTADDTVAGVTSAVPSPAPDSWQGAAWRGNGTAGANGIGAQSVVSSSRDPRVAAIVDGGVLVPKQWPISLWLGAHLVGDALSITMHFEGREFEVREVGAPGLEGEGSATVVGTPTLSGEWPITVRATETDTGMYATATLTIAAVVLEWSRSHGDTIHARVGDDVESTLTLTRSHENTAVQADPTTAGSGLNANIATSSGTEPIVVSVSGKLRRVGTHGMALTATANVRLSSVSRLALVTYEVLNKLPIWTAPGVGRISFAYTGAALVVPIRVIAPEQIALQFADGTAPEFAAIGAVVRDDASETTTSSIDAILPDEGLIAFELEAVVDENTITARTIHAQAFDKVESRSDVTIVSNSERDLAANEAPVVAHATAHKVTYTYGAHIVLVYDASATETAAIDLEWHGVSLLTIERADAGGATMKLAGNANGTVPGLERRGVVAATIEADGRVRARAGTAVTVGTIDIGRSDFTAYALTQSASHPAARVLNGNHDEVWMADENDPVPLPNWVGVDMQRTFRVSGLRILARQDHTSPERWSGVPRAVTVEVSMDNETWTVAASGEAYGARASSDPAAEAPDWRAFTFDAVDARYVRLRILSNVTGHAFAASLAAMEVEHALTTSDLPDRPATFRVTGGALIGSAYVAPLFDAAAPDAASLELTPPHFLPPWHKVYVYAEEFFEMSAVVADPDPRLEFAIVPHGNWWESGRLRQESIDAATARITGLLQGRAGSSATVIVRATRDNGTWLQSSFTLVSLAFTWPALDLGEATVWTSKRFAFEVTCIPSSFAVDLALTGQGDQGAGVNVFTVTSAVGASGELELDPTQAGPVTAQITATAKGVSRSRTVSVLVKNTRPTWTGGPARDLTVFASSSFETIVAATSSGDVTYELVGVDPVRDSDVVEVGHVDGRALGRVGAGTVSVRVEAKTTDDVRGDDRMLLTVDAYDAGTVFGATAEDPDGPPIESLLDSVRSTVAFRTLGGQLGDGERMRFAPETDGVTMRDGGVLVYSIELNVADSDGSGGGACSLEIPSIANIVHESVESGSNINITIRTQAAQPTLLGTKAVLAETVTADTVGAVLVVAWARDGSIRIYRVAESDAILAVDAESPGTNPADVNALDVRFETGDNGKCAVGGHMIATFPASSRLATWRAAGSGSGGG